MKIIMAMAMAIAVGGAQAKEWPQNVYETIEDVKAPVAVVAQACAFGVGVKQIITGKDGVKNPCRVRKVTQPINQVKRQVEKVSNLERQWKVLRSQF